MWGSGSGIWTPRTPGTPAGTLRGVRAVPYRWGIYERMTHRRHDRRHEIKARC